jgi:hypothetical protein
LMSGERLRALGGVAFIQEVARFKKIVALF